MITIRPSLSPNLYYPIVYYTSTSSLSDSWAVTHETTLAKRREKRFIYNNSSLMNGKCLFKRENPEADTQAVDSQRFTSNLVVVQKVEVRLFLDYFHMNERYGGKCICGCPGNYLILLPLTQYHIQNIAWRAVNNNISFKNIKLWKTCRWPFWECFKHIFNFSLPHYHIQNIARREAFGLSFPFIPPALRVIEAKSRRCQRIRSQSTFA